MNLLGLLLFILVVLGIFLSLREWGVSTYLGVITSFWLMTLALYVFAMLGYLQLGIYVVTTIGLLLLLRRIILRLLGKMKGNGLQIHLFDIWMLVGGLVIAIVLQRLNLIHYDNYSHWATIVKFMFFEQRLPGSSDAIISFSSYPVGNALFNNYFVNLVGFNPGNMLVAQFLYIWAALLGLFTFLKDKKRVMLSAILCLAVTLTMLANVEIGFNNLLVDYVIAAVTLTGLVGVGSYGNQPVLQAIHVFLASSNLLLIKNSGAFFVAIILIAYFAALCVFPKEKSWSIVRVIRIVIRWIMVTAAGFVPFIIWQIHVKQTFTSSKHQLDAAAFSGQLNGEGLDYMREIMQRMLDASLNLSSLSTRGLLMVNLVMFVTWLVLKLKKRKSPLLLQLVMLDTIFVLYYLSIFAMYLVSMPYDEAIVLAGFERYLSTVVILLILWGAGLFVRALDDNLYERNYEKRDLKSFRTLQNKKFYQRVSFALMFFSVIGINSEIGRLKYNEGLDQNRLPNMMAKMLPEEKTYNDKKVLVVDHNKDEVNSFYTGFVGKYYFFSANVDGQEAFDYSPAEFKALNNKYDYVLLLPKHETYVKLAKTTYHETLKPGLYKVTPDKLIAVKKMAL